MLKTKNPSSKKSSVNMCDPKSKFLSDLQNGKNGEIRTAKTIKKVEKAKSVEHVEEGKDYDFVCHFKDKSPVTYEVKSDFMAARTNNIFFEYFCNKSESGLSATKADKWAILLPHLSEIFVFKPEDMWTHLQRSKYRQVSGGDGGRASGFVVPIETVRGFGFVSTYAEVN